MILRVSDQSVTAVQLLSQ